jgi:hypothetical protein
MSTSTPCSLATFVASVSVMKPRSAPSSPVGPSSPSCYPEPCEHTFLTAQPHAHVRFRRAIERRALWLAEDAARELPNLSLPDALQLVHLYAERGSPKFEPAARRWLIRYLSEGTPGLEDVAKVTASLAKRADVS